jgi:hypothetical protein
MEMKVGQWWRVNVIRGHNRLSFNLPCGGKKTISEMKLFYESGTMDEVKKNCHNYYLLAIHCMYDVGNSTLFILPAVPRSYFQKSFNFWDMTSCKGKKVNLSVCLTN